MGGLDSYYDQKPCVKPGRIVKELPSGRDNEEFISYLRTFLAQLDASIVTHVHGSMTIEVQNPTDGRMQYIARRVHHMIYGREKG